MACNGPRPEWLGNHSQVPPPPPPKKYDPNEIPHKCKKRRKKDDSLVPIGFMGLLWWLLK